MIGNLIAALAAILPSATEALRIVSDKETRKDNSTKVSTTLAKIGVGASGVMFIEPNTPPDAALLTLAASLVLYLYRRRQAKGW
jgi:hypothetical protein